MEEPGADSGHRAAAELVRQIWVGSLEIRWRSSSQEPVGQSRQVSGNALHALYGSVSSPGLVLGSRASGSDHFHCNRQHHQDGADESIVLAMLQI